MQGQKWPRWPFGKAWPEKHGPPLGVQSCAKRLHACAKRMLVWSISVKYKSVPLRVTVQGRSPWSCAKHKHDRHPSGDDHALCACMVSYAQPKGAYCSFLKSSILTSLRGTIMRFAHAWFPTRSRSTCLLKPKVLKAYCSSLLWETIKSFALACLCFAQNCCSFLKSSI